MRGPNCCNLEHNVLHDELSGRLKGKPTQTRSSAFIDPVRNLPVSRGSELRLGSLLSAFISVSFTISLSCSPSLSALLPLTPPPLFLPLQHPRPSCTFTPRSRRRKCHQIKLVGARNLACLPLSVRSSER